LIWTTLAGSLCFFIIGLADDLFALSPWPRLAGQVAVAVVVWSQGVRIGAIDFPWLMEAGSPLVLPEPLSLMATVIWLVGITNAINWLDGLDGLAAGVARIAAVGLVSVSFSLHQVAAGFLAAALAGCCLVFCATTSIRPDLHGRWRFLLPGFTLAAISIVRPAKAHHRQPVAALLILSLPSPT
jgi:UDP-N-acetylmuramyl pentapeptide phosphotransferase/UDP-N-acetylglucosamine-1-phosphate transferase